MYAALARAGILGHSRFYHFGCILPILGQCFTFWGKRRRLLHRGNREHCLGGIRESSRFAPV